MKPVWVRVTSRKEQPQVMKGMKSEKRVASSALTMPTKNMMKQEK
jgi:hypothetical protein